jgi:murein DD-endopeptidase MepM/ murein hydrolase activator NlpD
VPASDPFDELTSPQPQVRRRDLREAPTRRSRKAARKRAQALSKAEGYLSRPSGRRAATAAPIKTSAKRAPSKSTVRKSLGRRVATKLFPIAALGFAAALIIGTSVPASAFSLPSAKLAAPKVVHSKTATVAGQSLGRVTGAATPVSRDEFEAMSEQELTQIQEVSAGAGYTVNNSGVIRWPFDVAVPLGDPFGPRAAPCGGCSTFHNGTDFETGGGASVQAVAAGVVTVSEYSGALGQHVAIEHTVNGKTFTSIYGHMESGSSPLVVGQTVVEGQFVGFTGSTGQSTGPHLDFEIDIDDTPVDSFAWLKANTAH